MTNSAELRGQTISVGFIGLALGTAAAAAYSHSQIWLAIFDVAGLVLVGRTCLRARACQKDYQRVHRQLQEREVRYRDFLDEANDLIQIIAPDGKLLYVNRAWRQTLGYSEEEIPTLSLFDVICPESLPHCMATFQRLMAGKAVGRIEAQFRSKDGKIIHVEGSTSCRREEGLILNTRGIFRDVTERKLAEEALRESQEKLRQALRRRRFGPAKTR